ncbi:LCP family protein [Virgibacillus doumboii]|uniref:LCP family glycopolymer transferase n=1 Tax=Virgibacillus doumboii TaxID=2697503 RepID=UPI001FE4709C|nr:LCP family protein [Virgibacillus doumboii]
MLKKKWVLYSGIVIAVLIIAGVGYGLHLYNKTEDIVKDSQKDIGRENKTSELREEKVDPVEDNVSVLFIGVDNSEKRDYDLGSRSDALILATFNKQENSVKLLSIPRDSYVYVPEVGYKTKINHAHFYGGPKATIETVENLLHVPVDYYVRLNFEAFIETVDSLDGIHYDVPFEMYEQDSADNANAIHLLPGPQTLTGEEALALARSRKYDDDLERGKRQQQILKSIKEKATSVTSLFKLDNLIEAVGSNMKTNMAFDDMKSFLSYGIDENITIESVGINGHGEFLDDGLWYYILEEDSVNSIQNELRSHLDLTTNLERFADDDEQDNAF